MKRVKGLMSFLLVAMLLMSTAFNSSFVLAADNIAVEIDSMRVNFSDQQPVIVDGRTLVPVRGVFEALGFLVIWESDTQTAVLGNETNTIRITIGVPFFYVNGDKYILDVPAQVINGRTMLPIRAVLEAVGCDLYWDSGRNTAMISSNGIKEYGSWDAIAYWNGTENTTPQPTPTTSNNGYYSDFPTVPDFAFEVNKEIEFIRRNDGQYNGYIYHVNVSDVANLFDIYVKALISEGFKEADLYVSSPEYASGSGGLKVFQKGNIAVRVEYYTGHSARISDSHAEFQVFLGQATPTPQLANYSEYPSVPKFGNQPDLAMPFDVGVGMFYYYSAKDVYATDTAIMEYIKVLTDYGFIFNQAPSDDSRYSCEKNGINVSIIYNSSLEIGRASDPGYIIIRVEPKTSTPQPTPIPQSTEAIIGAPGVNIDIFMPTVDVESGFTYTVNTADGITVFWIGRYNGQKEIKYYTLNWVLYNSVGDPAPCRIQKTNRISTKFAGPASTGATLISSNKVIAYTTAIKKIVLETIDIEYMDGTKETVNYGYSTTDKRKSWGGSK